MKNNKRKLRISILFVLLLFISLGYAFLNTSLNIIGTSNISNPTWDIHWENVVVKSGSVTASTPTIDTSKTTVNYSVTLTIPGEYYEFTVDAVNAGTIDGMVSVFSSKLNNVEITTLPNYLEYYVTYADGIAIEQNQLLAAGTSEKYKVHVGYKKDINASDIPQDSQTLNLSFSVTYVQSGDSSITINRPTLKEYSFSSSNDFKSQTYRDKIKIINIEQEINPPSNVIESWDIGVSQNGNVMAYITQNLSDNTLYDLYIQGDGQLYTNPNSSYLFKDLKGLERINNLNILNTSKTTKMTSMFYNAGYNSSSFNIDVSNFDTSNVTEMGNMFYYAGYKATTWSIGDIGSWKTSGVTDMHSMFESAGFYASEFNIGNLSNWDTSHVELMHLMFSSAGNQATNWYVGDLSDWNVSNVIEIEAMFDYAGNKASLWDIGDLSNWNTSNVAYMNHMFNSAGFSSTVFDIGDLSNWDTSNVIDMRGMFQQAGFNATTWNSVGTIKVYASQIDGMFGYCKNCKATLKIYNNPSSYVDVFKNASIISGSGITVDYASSVTDIDSIIATKSSDSNVVKGSLIS